MVNETLADMLLDSTKDEFSENPSKPNPEQLFWLLRQAPMGVDFPLTARMIENCKTIAIMAVSACGDKEVGKTLMGLELRIYHEYKLAVNALSSESGKMIRTLQTQVSEQSHFGNIMQTKKSGGVQSFFQNRNQ